MRIEQLKKELKAIYQFTDEVINELCNYCIKKSILDKRYILALAKHWNDYNIKTMEDLSKFYDMQEKISKIATTIKDRFNLKRDITYYEQCYIEKWLKDYEYNFEIIELALDIKKHQSDLSIDKINQIITAWHDRNLKTYNEIQGFINKNKRK